MGAFDSFDGYQDQRLPRGLGGLFYGVYPALVTDLNDPAGQGRVKVRLPWSPDEGQGYEVWARIATLMAGNNRGSWFIPDLDDEVLVAFAGGDPRTPFVLGGLWNGRDAPPETMDSGGRNEIKKLRSRNGVTVTMEDKQGREKLIIETPGGQRVTLEDGPGAVEIVDSNGNSITMNSSGVSIQSKGTLQVQASSVTISAGDVSVNSGIATFSGTIQAQTVIATSVIGASYTPGAGNIW